jgi:hypothetical protein
MCAAFRISVRNNSITIQILRIDASHSSDMSLFLQSKWIAEEDLAIVDYCYRRVGIYGLKPHPTEWNDGFGDHARWMSLHLVEKWRPFVKETKLTYMYTQR